MVAAGDVMQTHISTLVYAGDLVYKFLKPQRHSFLDASTVEARRQLCAREVAENRRFAPDVYLGTAELVVDERVIDHAVVMRRLPADRSLAALIHTAEADEAIRQVVEAVVAFHDRAPRLSPADEPDPAATERARWRTAFDALRGRPQFGRSNTQLLDENERLASRCLAAHATLLEQRVEQGWLREGHGDLLPEDCYYLTDGPRLLDCIAFSDALRRVDTLADVCFLAEGVERLCGATMASRVIAFYEAASGTTHPRSLAHHFVAYRAHVRASVTEGDVEDALRRGGRHLLRALDVGPGTLRR